MKIRWTDQAYERLSEIESYVLLRSSSNTAKALVELLIQRTETLVEFPFIGRSVKESIRSDIREIIEGNYRIVYRIEDNYIDVLTVFEGHRLLPEEDLQELD